MIGTHNSLSYLKPIKWWMKLINFTSKCQNMTIEEQYKYGVRYFDIRLVPYDMWKSAHGLVKYDVNIYDVLSYLNDNSSESCPIYVALNLEKNNPNNNELWWFMWKFRKLREKFPNIIFCGGYIKPSWKQVVKCTNPVVHEKYWTFNSCKTQNKVNYIKALYNILHFSPKWWAKKDNKEHYANNAYTNNNEVLMLDFVEIC